MGRRKRGGYEKGSGKKARRVFTSEFENDWDQARDFHKTTRRNVEKFFTRKTVGVTMKRLWKDRNETFEASNLEEVDESLIVVGADKQPLIYFLRGGLGFPFVKKDAGDVGLKALERLREEYPPPQPRENDIRHKDTLHGEFDGSYHFALWHATGHKNRVGNESKLMKGAVVSKDVINSGKRLNATMEFLHSFTPVTQAVGSLFEVIDPEGYRRCKNRLDDLGKDTAASMFQVSSRSCFFGMAVLAGLCCLPHRDKGDLETAWVADLAFGDFEGGYLEVPQIGLKFRLKQGDVMFMKSALLQHSVSTVSEGYRYGVVYFSHKSLFDAK